MKKILLIAVVAGLTVSCAATAEKKQVESPGKPNVIVIIGDDHGYADWSGSSFPAADIQTPHLDRLAQSGIRFTQGYVTSPICSPSRLGLFTGRYQQRWGVQFYGGAHMPNNETCIAEVLKKQGYATGMVGKYHTTQEGKAHPMDCGFDSFYGFNHGTKHFLIHTAEGARRFEGGNFSAGPMWVNREQKDQQGYSTTLFEEQAIRFIETNKDKPFFLTLSFNAVHLFIQLPEEDLKKEGLAPFAMWDPEKEPGHKGYLAWYYRTLKKFGDDASPHDPDGRARYRICLRYMDNAIGTVLDKLNELNLQDNTLVIYLSDNGGSPRTYSQNKPLRGYKYNLYEGGIRVPFIVSWPRMFPKNKTMDTVVSALDIAPTLTAITGADVSMDKPYDGLNLLPLLTGAQTSAAPRSLFWKKGRETEWAARSGVWKLVKPKGKAPELYDLSEDRGETTDLAQQYPDKVEHIQKQYRDWEKMGAAGPNRIGTVTN